MTYARTLIFFAALLSAVSGWAGEAVQRSDNEEQFAQLLANGVQLIKSGNPGGAIAYFDKVIAGYEEAYKGENQKLYSARSSTETLMYLVEAANANVSAKVVSADWAYAYYFKAYALLELGNAGEAKGLLARAIAMSPRNSQFLSEMGHISQREKNWPEALAVFQAAASAAREFSPPDAKNIELARAWRGLGYVYVEQGKLDDAEKMYRQCLDLDAKDSRALNELQYIQGVRAKSGAR